MQWQYGTAVHSDPEALPNTAEISVLDIYNTATKVQICQSEKSFAEDLVSAGYLGTSPLHPELANSLKTLELF